MHAADLGRQIAHGRQETVGGAHVGEHGYVVIAFHRQTPIASSRAQPARQALAGVAAFKIRGVQVNDRMAVEAQRDRSVPLAVVVDRRYPNRGVGPRVVDEAHEALTHRIGFRHHQRHHEGVRVHDSKRGAQRERQSDAPRRVGCASARSAEPAWMPFGSLTCRTRSVCSS